MVTLPPATAMTTPPSKASPWALAAAQPQPSTSTGGPTTSATPTNLEKLARFQQKQLQEKEQKLLQLYDQQRLRAHQVAQRGSAGSSNGNTTGINNNHLHHSTTKSRQMQTEESTRRHQIQHKGIDKSYPLEPLNGGKSRKPNPRTTAKRSGSKPDVNSNSESHNESIAASRVNGHYEINIDDVIDDEAMQRNRMYAKFQPRTTSTTDSPVQRKNTTPTTTTTTTRKSTVASSRQSSVMKVTKSSSLKMRQKVFLLKKSKEKLKKKQTVGSNKKKCCKRGNHISDECDPLKSTPLICEVIKNNLSRQGSKEEEEDPCTDDSEKLGKVKSIVMKIENITTGLRASAKILFKLNRKSEGKKNNEKSVTSLKGSLSSKNMIEDSKDSKIQEITEEKKSDTGEIKNHAESTKNIDEAKEDSKSKMPISDESKKSEIEEKIDEAKDTECKKVIPGETRNPGARKKSDSRPEDLGSKKKLLVEIKDKDSKKMCNDEIGDQESKKKIDKNKDVEKNKKKKTFDEIKDPVVESKKKINETIDLLAAEIKKKIEEHPRSPSADELRRESFELKRQMFEQILGDKRRDSVESALQCFDSISAEEQPKPKHRQASLSDEKKPCIRGFEKSTAAWEMHIAKENLEKRRSIKKSRKSLPDCSRRKKSAAELKKSRSCSMIKHKSYDINVDDYSLLTRSSSTNGAISGGPRKNSTVSPSQTPSAAPEPKSRHQAGSKSSSMKFLSRIVGSNGDLEFTSENGYSSAPPPRKSSFTQLDFPTNEQKSGPPITPTPRTSTLTPTSGAGIKSNNIAGSRTSFSKTKTTGGVGAKTLATSDSSNHSSDNSNLTTCKICNRRFNSERITLHEQICAKTASKKRKQFDVVTHRVKGTELESFVQKPLKGGKAKSSSSSKVEQENKLPKSNWRRKHEDFINAIRSAKQMQSYLAAGGKLSDLPPPPASDTSDYIQCPHCSRKFNAGAAERHIPKCADMQHNKPKAAVRAKR